MRVLALAMVLVTLAACGSQSGNTGTQQSHLRTAPLVTCTADQQKACPAVQAQTCTAGQEAVIDYSSDCCAHVTCQPVCQKTTACPMTPAPVCPPGTHIWIGTAVQDCCPAFRCDPDTTQCDPTKPTACTLAIPVCPGNVPPVVVGQSNDCCPIYQCACGVATSPSAAVLAATCGCTKPTCRPGETTVCAGTDPCGGPCTCQPQQAGCATDADCPTAQRCNVTCVGWGCATASGTGTVGAGATGTAPSGTAPSGIPSTCSCPSGDTSCHCDSAGNCTGQTCTSQCASTPPACDPTKPVACPMSLSACPGGQQPLVVGTDPVSCCPIQKCPACPMTASPVACPGMFCKCAKQTGIDPNSCCPSYTCGSVDPGTGNCL